MPTCSVSEWDRLAVLGFVRHVLSRQDDIKAVQLWHEVDRDGVWLIVDQDFKDTIEKVFGSGSSKAKLIAAIESLRGQVGFQ